MLEGGKISVRQLTILVMLVTLGDSILVLPSIATFDAKQDAWISILIGMVTGLSTVYLFYKVWKLNPHLTLIQSIQQILGKWFGTLVSLLFLVYFFLSATAHVREIGDFMTIEMMQQTPTQAIQIIFICIIIMAAQLGLEVIGRTAEIFTPLIFILFFILFFFLAPEYEFERIQPILEDGIKPILHGSISCLAFPFVELVVFLMVFPYVNTPSKIKQSLLQGALIGGIILTLLTFASILVLGAEQTARSIYPSYSLARRVTIDHFLDRVESTIALLWLLTMFFKISIYFYSFILGLAQLCKLKEHRMLAFPSAVLLIALSPVITPNIAYYNRLLSKYWIYFDLTYGLLFPLLLIAVYFCRKLNKVPAQT
ncbi:GerAB/ArcD/ProY family transporter [Paenibacillus segetis]|uniref:Germination protein n=1 Tax=Paenibacillus segetis TaxID=1325360 RepID=A0ABQ1YSB7_9BACL|nr:endospore germination permease [Paenibacillus segetis]GGH36980.1 germination protein [Paenibacillus segetis]